MTFSIGFDGQSSLSSVDILGLYVHLCVDLFKNGIGVESGDLIFLLNGKEDNGVELLVIAPPSLVEGGLDVEVNLVGVADLFVFVDVVAEGVAND